MNSLKISCAFCFKNILFFLFFTEIFSVLHHQEPRKIISLSSLSENGYYSPGSFYPFRAKIESSQKEELDLDFNQTLSATIALNPDNTVCYEDLGCITRFSFADPFLWPINLLPEPREKIKTHFTLYTREQPYSTQSILISAKDPDGITATSFRASRPTKFYIHGWHASGYEDRYKTFVERLLTNNNVNIVFVHWGGGANTNYDQAHANTRLVGLEVAFLVNTMVNKFGVKASDVHLIGHSLGAHTAGYAGEKIFNLGRITGLDPAGPYFRGMPPFASLDPSDANFVDAVHTDGGFLGIYRSVGHLDFYPNGGVSQPGCDSTNWSTNQNNDSMISCNHVRSIYLYSESFLPDSCQSVGYECSDYESFNRGECTSCGSDNKRCSPFGLQANTYPIDSRINVKFYFNTGPNFPFCRYHYAVNINLAKPQEAKTKVTGKLRLSVSGEKGVLGYTNLPLTHLEHGKDSRYLLMAPTSLGRVSKVNLRWKYVVADLLDVTCFLGLCNRRLYVNSVTISELNNYPEDKRIANTFKNCPQSTPGVIRSYLSLELSTENSCTTVFRNSILLHVIWVPESWSAYN